jgi:hypothetical protein
LERRGAEEGVSTTPSGFFFEISKELRSTRGESTSGEGQKAEGAGKHGKSNRNKIDKVMIFLNFLKCLQFNN